MDVWVRFYDEDNDKMCTRYFGSQFLDKATATDLKFHLNKAMEKLDLSKLLQISMDGPSVNLKLHWEFAAERSEEYPTATNLFDIRVFSLHVIQGSFST